MDTCDNLPKQFIERLKELYDENDILSLFSAMSDKQTVAFRTNTLKTTSPLLKKDLSKQDFIIEQVPWYADAFLLKNKSVRALTETDMYKNGHIYIQNLSSMIPALALDPKKGEKILDIAAAPGSKTTQIAALMENTGELTANDSSFKRLFKLKENLSQMGVTNTKVLNLRGESFWKKLPEYFDRTLVDVPCSMEGRIRCDDQKTYKDWSTKKIKQLSNMQKYLLRSAVSATKVGGTIIYSTCTLAPEENEAVVEWVFAKSPTALTIEKIAIPTLPLQDGKSLWGKKHFIHGQNTSRIFPSQTMEGFFVAKIRKIHSTL